MIESIANRLLNCSIPEPNSGCWIWLRAIAPNGYGRLTVGSMSDGSRRHVGAHRASYEAFIGPIPPGMIVMHVCDNRACINPDHLSVGTQKDNVDDMNRKRRHPHPMKFACKNGHPFSDETSVLRGEGNARRCLICARVSYNKYTPKRKLRWAIA